MLKGTFVKSQERYRCIIRFNRDKPEKEEILPNPMTQCPVKQRLHDTGNALYNAMHIYISNSSVGNQIMYLFTLKL